MSLKRKIKRRRIVRIPHEPQLRRTKHMPGSLVQFIDAPKPPGPNEWVMNVGILFINGRLSGEDIPAAIGSTRFSEDFHKNSDAYSKSAMVIETTIAKNNGELFYKVLFDEKLWWVSCWDIKGKFRG